MNATKLLLFGDPHLKKGRQYEYLPMLEAIIELIKKVEPDGVGFMGDYLDAHENVDVTAQCDAFRTIFTVSQQLGIPVINLVGNHDLRNNSEYLTGYSSMYGLTYTPNVMLIDRPQVVTIGNTKIGVVPYVPTHRMQEAMTGVDWSGVRLFLTHQEWKDSLYNGKLSTGDDSALVRELVDREVPIYNGHIHEYGRPHPNLLNVGTVRQITFAESEDKAALLLTITDDAIIEERIFLDLPKKITVRLTVPQTERWVGTIGERDHYRVELRGTAAEIEVFYKSELHRSMKQRGIKFKPIYEREVVPIRSQRVDERGFMERVEEFVGYDELQLQWMRELFPN